MNELSRYKKKLIQYAIDTCKTIDETILIPFICEELQSRYSDRKLEFELRRIGLMNTTEIKEAICLYVASHEKELIKKGYLKEGRGGMLNVSIKK